MKWLALHGHKLEALREVARQNKDKKDGKVPKTLSEFPPLRPDLEWTADGFHILSRRRAFTPGGSPTGIPITEAIAWAESQGVEDIQYFLEVLEIADRAFCEVVISKQAAQAKGGFSSGGTSGDRGNGKRIGRRERR